MHLLVFALCFSHLLWVLFSLFLWVPSRLCSEKGSEKSVAVHPDNANTLLVSLHGTLSTHEV